MNKKPLLSIGAVAILIVTAGVYLTACGGNKSNGPIITTINEKAVATITKEKEAGCTAGITKIIVGRTYTITGAESYTIQGKSYDLCCWETGQGKNQKKICNDRTASPIGYDYGVLFENNPDTGNLYKSMETFKEGSKVCQQFYNVDGTTGALNCQERSN